MSNHSADGREILWKERKETRQVWNELISRHAIPGRGHRALHDQLKHMMVSMMKVAGVQANVEAANFLNDKIGDPYI
jgi:hypothetical protein